MRIGIDIACNDPDNGLFDGRARAIHVDMPGDTLMELAASDMVGPRMREVDFGIAISNKHWPVLGSAYGVGNWCWNRYWMSVETAVDFLAWTHQRGRFDVEQAEERLFAAWKCPRALPVDLFREILIRKAAQ
ncbi:hypothetical protein [Sphingobium yanoikuyae]|uniref:hypothetical protein n=1 Tax=Sphingobium yanoikuyae TaxID=13690 RepID=UPI0026EB7837|nr:hypothetical protein [Sphingobium yanoikuyae]